MLIIVDTSFWIGYFNGIENPQTDFLNTVLDKPPTLIGCLILAEVLRGFRHDPNFRKSAALWEGICKETWSALY